MLGKNKIYKSDYVRCFFSCVRVRGTVASRDHSRGGGGWVLRDAKPYFTDRNYFVTLIFCYKFNSTDEFSASCGGCTPPLPCTLRPWSESIVSVSILIIFSLLKHQTLQCHPKYRNIDMNDVLRIIGGSTSPLPASDGSVARPPFQVSPNPFTANSFPER